MNKKIRIYLFSFIAVTALTVSLFSTMSVRADDATPPPATGEPAATQAPADTNVPPAATEAPAATDVPTATEVPAATDVPTATDAPTATAAPTSTDAPVATTMTEQAPAEPLTVPEALDQLPDGTDLVVLDENGDALPLVSDDAASILASPDPYFFDGTNYVGYSASGICPVIVATCNTDSNPIQAAVDAYATSGTATGNIYVESGSYNENVIIDGTSGGGYLSNLTGLIGISGSGSTTLAGYFEIYNMNAFTLSGFTVDDGSGGGYVYASDNNGTLMLNDLVVSDGEGIEVDNQTGDVIVTNVTADNTDGGYPGLAIDASGDVSVTDSQFNNTQSGKDGLNVDSGGNVDVTRVTATNNDSKGVNISASGSITLTDVIAEYNGDDGAQLGSCGCNPGGIFVSGGSFSHNDFYGLEAYGYDDIHLGGVSAEYNDWGGASLGTDGNIFVDGSNFSHNYGDGLNAESLGNITLKNITAVDNAYDGASLVNAQGSGDVNVSNSVFNFNGWDNEAGAGLDIYTNGNINISSVTASNNTFDGAFLDPTSISAMCSTFNDNGDTGLNVDLAGGTGTFNTIGASGNSTDINIFDGSYTLGVTDCNTSNNGGGSHKPVGSGCNGETVVLTNEDRLIFQCTEAGHNQEEVLTQNNLPGPLPGKTTFVSGFTVHLILNGVEVMVSPDPQILQFKLPKDANIEDYLILFWNGTEWVEVSGASITEDGYLQISTTQEGTYVLVHK